MNLGLHLFAQAKFFKRGFVGRKVRLLKVFQQALALTYHLNQSAARHTVVLIGLEMFSHLFDTSRQDRNLRLRAAYIVLVDLSQSNSFRFVIL